MKKMLLLIITCLSLSALKAQDWTIYKKGTIYPGFYVTNSNDTVYGYFQHDDKKGQQKKIKFYKNEMDRKPTEEFKPEDIKGYKIADKLYRTLNYSGGLFNKPLRFLLVTKDGALTTFVFYSEDAEMNEGMVFHKPNDPQHNDPITPAYFGLQFAKKMADYISDYPALSKKVADKEKGYGLLNIEAIIHEYNEWYATKAK